MRTTESTLRRVAEHGDGEERSSRFAIHPRPEWLSSHWQLQTIPSRLGSRTVADWGEESLECLPLTTIAPAAMAAL